MLNESLPCPDLRPLSEKVTFTCVPASCARRASDDAPSHEAAASPQLLPVRLCVDPDRSQLDRHKFSSSPSSASLSSSLVRALLQLGLFPPLNLLVLPHRPFCRLWLILSVNFLTSEDKNDLKSKKKKPTSTPEKSFFHLLTNIHLCGHK